MLRGCQREFRQGGEDDDDDDEDGDDESPPRPSGESDCTGIQAVFQTCHLLCMHRGVENPHIVKNTHKYCLFLACLKAARVWSLLKSPESDSKMSSIRIPAYGLHMPLIVDAYDATMCGCFCMC